MFKPNDDSDSHLCYGHDVPPFSAVFPEVFRAGLTVMTPAQIALVAQQLGDEDRRIIAAELGADGLAQLAAELPADKAAALAGYDPTTRGPDPVAFRRAYPRLAAHTHNTLSLEQLCAMLQELTAEQLASQSLWLGVEGRRGLFSAMARDRTETILDHTEDWVLLESGRRALAAINQYTAVLEKQERIGKKMQGCETIALKVRHQPSAMVLQWLAGPHRGRAALYNEQLLGPGRLRVRERGVLGIVPVTIGVDSAVARRGTKHLVTEVGLLPLLTLIDRDYRRASAAGDLRRTNHGIVEYDGQPVYRIESILPRDRTRGYYCHRMVHHTDFVRALELKAEIYDFDNRLDEVFAYRNIDTEAALHDDDFNPNNRAYRL